MIKVKEIRKNLGLTQEKLAEKLNVNIRTVQKWEGGEASISGKSLLTLQKLNNEFKGVSGEKLKEYGVPMIPISAVAGFTCGDNEGISLSDCEMYSVPEFERKGVQFVIRISGSSMYPKYSNGDIIGCKKIEEILFFQWGKVYVLDTSQGVLVKRVFESKTSKDHITLVSDNKDNYPPFDIPKSDVRSLSIVIGVIRLE